MTKKDKIETCRKILYKYDINTIVSNEDEFNYLMDMFQNHQNWELKKGNGVESISVIASLYGTRCFQLNRFDKTTTDISFMVSLSARTKLSDIKKAARHAIRPEIVRFREENTIYGTKCPINEEVLTPMNTHIDHYDKTFDEMFNDWMKDKDVDALFKKVNETEDNSMLTYFTDNKINQEFIDYHNKNCKLRAVSKTSNLSILRKL